MYNSISWEKKLAKKLTSKENEANFYLLMIYRYKISPFNPLFRVKTEVCPRVCRLLFMKNIKNIAIFAKSNKKMWRIAKKKKSLLKKCSKMIKNTFSLPNCYTELKKTYFTSKLVQSYSKIAETVTLEWLAKKNEDFNFFFKINWRTPM